MLVSQLHCVSVKRSSVAVPDNNVRFVKSGHGLLTLYVAGASCGSLLVSQSQLGPFTYEGRQTAGCICSELSTIFRGYISSRARDIACGYLLSQVSLPNHSCSRTSVMPRMIRARS